MLGVMTEVEIQAVPAHRLVERIEHWHFSEAFGRLDELARAHRHYSFFYIPTEASAALYDLAMPPGRASPTLYVKIYDLAGDDVPDSTSRAGASAASYEIYPAVFEPNFHELEYFVPYEPRRRGARPRCASDAVAAAAVIFPMEVRTVAREDAWLSHSYGRGSLVISVSGQPGTDYEPYLRDVHALLGQFDARVHWGKLHYLTRTSCTRAIRGRRSSSRCGASSTRTACSDDDLRPLFA